MATTNLDFDIEANQSASELLMPTKEFKELVEYYKGNVGKVADAFKVPTLAVRYRAEGLGYSVELNIKGDF